MHKWVKKLVGFNVSYRLLFPEMAVKWWWFWWEERNPNKAINRYATLPEDVHYVHYLHRHALECVSISLRVYGSFKFPITTNYHDIASIDNASHQGAHTITHQELFNQGHLFPKDCSADNLDTPPTSTPAPPSISSPSYPQSPVSSIPCFLKLLKFSTFSPAAHNKFCRTTSTPNCNLIAIFKFHPLLLSRILTVQSFPELRRTRIWLVGPIRCSRSGIVINLLATFLRELMIPERASWVAPWRMRKSSGLR